MPIWQAMKRSSKMTITVDTFEEEEVEPLTDIVSKINTTNEAIKNQTASLLEMLNQLHGTTPEADAELKQFLKEFKG